MPNEIQAYSEAPLQQRGTNPDATNDALAARLRSASSSRVDLRDGSVMLAEGASVEDVRAALAIIDGALVPGPQTQIAAQLARLCVACARPPNLDDDGEELWVMSMGETLMEYLLDCVIAAIKDWRATQKWWPSESDLRKLCELHSADRRRIREEASATIKLMERAAESRQTQAQRRSINPSGRTAQFVAKAREMYGADWARSWFVGGVNVMFTDTTIYTTAVGYDELRAKCSKIADAYCVVVLICPEVRQMLAAHQSEDEFFAAAKKRRTA